MYVYYYPLGVSCKALNLRFISDHCRANSNVNNTAFWLLSHILFDDGLRNTIQQEVDGAWSTGDLDLKHLSNSSPALDSAFHECLRLHAGAMIGRKVSVPTRIGDKMLRKGASVLIPSRQLHSNQGVWGPEHMRFDAKRFMKNPSLVRDSAFRAFGGGVSFCPGRKIAKEQIFAFIALLFRGFNIALDKEKSQEFPQTKHSTPALGVLAPAKHSDVLVRLRRVEK